MLERVPEEPDTIQRTPAHVMNTGKAQRGTCSSAASSGAITFKALCLGGRTSFQNVS